MASDGGRTLDAGNGVRFTPATGALLALPLIGLAFLLVRPELDLEWRHDPSHFWLVLVAAALNGILAYLANGVAGRQRDARLVLVSLTFLSSAAFLGLHALATPGVLLPGANVGFAIATPIGLVLASIFAAASVSPLAGPRASVVLGMRTPLLALVMALIGFWAVVSLLGLPPLDGPPPAREGAGPLDVLSVGAVALYAYSAWRAYRLHRQRGGALLRAMVVALILLAEATIAVSLSRNWQLSWWEWHLLLLAAFGAIALGARSEYRRGGSLTAAFGGLYLEATLQRVDRWYATAVAQVAAAEARGVPTDTVLDELRHEGATDEQLALLARTATELRRLDEAVRPYHPTILADDIRGRDVRATRLGGEERDVSVVFADLAGFTTFSERRAPTDVIAMLNEYWGAVVPAIDAAGGVIEQFAGDGVMVIFNAAGDQPDHARRAAHAARAIVAAGRPIAAANPDWPVFRVGVNSGRAVVGSVGADARRSFAAIGDTVNTAARLMSAGDPGQVVVGRATWDALGDDRVGSALGPVRVKGRETPVEAWVLETRP